MSGDEQLWRRPHANPETVRAALLVLGAVIAVALVVLLAKPLLVLFGGILFALFLRSTAGAASRVTRLPYVACLVAIVVALVTAAVASVLMVGPKIVEQLTELARKLPDAARAVGDFVSEQSGRPIGLGIFHDAAPDARTVATGAVIAAGTVVEIVSALVVVFFVGVYGAARPNDYRATVLALVPDHLRERTGATLDEGARNLTRWLLGRIVAMVFVGVTCSIAFALLEVPLAFTLGILAGLLTFIEYVGAVVSAVPPLLLAFTRSPGTALAVLAVYTVVHIVEGYVLTPLLARVSVRFPPAVTLAGQVLMAALVGPLGLTFSTPVLVCLAVIVRSARMPSESG
jgi:predicted PurR-regulated permease PerM